MSYTNDLLQYSAPHPFVLPSTITQTTGWGPFATTTKTLYYAIPFDGRYLEQIMYNINKARTRYWEMEPIQFHTYHADGRVKQSFYPLPNYSYLNDQISIIAFANIVEDIKDAIEDTIEAPDSLRSHFGRCFNIAHYRGVPFVSRGLLERFPNMKQDYVNKNIPFYTFPEDLSGETMHGAFHNFEYYLPAASNPTRQLFVDAFQKAKLRLTDGIPLFTRMQNGEWPITKDELISLLGMSIYSKHGDPNKRPTENDSWTSELDRYSITDHRRIFWTFCSFVIQMLRYTIPKLELFRTRHDEIQGTWWTSKWYLRRENCAIFWSQQQVSKMLDFDSGLWHFCGHGRFDGTGGYLDVPPPGRGTSLTWFTDCNVIDKQFAPYLPYGFAPGEWYFRYECQDPRYTAFWEFHKFQTFELQTTEDVSGYYGDGGNGIVVRLSIDPTETIPARTGGPVRDFLPDDSLANVVFLYGAPQENISIYDEFVAKNSDSSLLSTYHNTITGITIACINDTQYPSENCNYSGGETGSLAAKITRLGFLDDGIHKPEEFFD